MQKWKHYKDLRQKYHQKQQEIIDKISPLISSMQKEIRGCNFPPESVYIKAIEQITGKKYYDYKIAEITPIIPKNYRLDYVMQNSYSYQLSSPNIGLTEDGVKKVREHHENISNIVKKDYENDIRSLIDIESEIKKMQNELDGNLMRLINYPEYCNMTCEYIFPKN